MITRQPVLKHHSTDKRLGRNTENVYKKIKHHVEQNKNLVKVHII